VIAWNIKAAAETFHPNRRGFTGILTQVDTVSRMAISGSRGHKVILTRGAVEEDLHTLIGMAVDYKSGWEGHNARQKVGVITAAKLKGKDLVIEGFLYVKDYPEIVKELSDPKNPMGMSYELADAHVEDLRATVWKVTKVAFTGAAILYQNRAAYSGTKFELKDAHEKPKKRSIGDTKFPNSIPVSPNPYISVA
jgi:hypothetical protein